MFGKGCGRFVHDVTSGSHDSETAREAVARAVPDEFVAATAAEPLSAPPAGIVAWAPAVRNAYLEGQRAAVASQPETANPHLHDATGRGPRFPVLGSAWQDGWAAEHEIQARVQHVLAAARWLLEVDAVALEWFRTPSLHLPDGTVVSPAQLASTEAGAKLLEQVILERAAATDE